MSYIGSVDSSISKINNIHHEVVDKINTKLNDFERCIRSNKLMAGAHTAEAHKFRICEIQLNKMRREVGQLSNLNSEIIKLFELTKSELKLKLIISEKTGKDIQYISEQDMKAHADARYSESLSDWLPPELVQKPKPKSKRQVKQGQTKKNNHTAQKKQQVKKVEIQVQENRVAVESVSPEIRRAQFLQSLLVMNPNIRLKEHSRVTQRWKDANFDEIRAFVDYDSEGFPVRRYQHLSDNQIGVQRARHYLPGLEEIMRNEKFKRLYTFPTSKGVGMIASLHYEETSEPGVVYLGIGSENGHGIIYHKYFEPVFESGVKPNVLNDSKEVVQEVHEEDDWVNSLPFNPEINDRGVLLLRFPNESHRLRIEPIRSDLLDKDIFIVED